MADRKVSSLNALTAPAANDYLPIVDVSEVAAASKNKRIDVSVLLSAIPNGTITDAMVSSTAEIAVSKLADGAARQLLQTDAAGTGVEWASNIDIPGTLDVTGAATFDAAVTIQGDLTVNGTTTNINTQNLVVEDKNIIIADVTTPTDVTADGGGITLKGTTDKTINWVDSTDAWTFSEHVSIASGKEYRINGTKVLDATSLGSAVLITSANITDGTIVNGDINASAAIAHSKLANITAASVLLGNASNVPTATAVTGDVTINSSGVTAIGSGKVTSTMILDGTIVDGDINASAAIVDTKLATISTAGKVSGTAITSGNISTSGSFATSSSVTSSSATAGIGYTTGAGGTVTQLTSRTTGVTLNTICGTITLFSKTTTAGLSEQFTVTCSACAAGDRIIFNHLSGGTIGAYSIQGNSAAGSFTVNIYTPLAQGTAAAPVIGYAIIKAVTA